MRGVKGSGKAKTDAPRAAKARRWSKKAEAATAPETGDAPPVPEQAAVTEATLEALPPQEATREDQPPAGHDAGLAAAETALVAKYPGQRFKPGSLRPSGATAEFGNKRSVIILCRDCRAERRIATSDAFHTSRCEPCGKKAKNEARKRTKGG